MNIVAFAVMPILAILYFQ